MSDTDNVFTAEKIIAKKYINGVVHYYIKWAGYDSKDNTWEPPHNIIDESLITAFESQSGRKKRKTRRSSAGTKSRPKHIKRETSPDLDNAEDDTESPPAPTTSKTTTSETTFRSTPTPTENDESTSKPGSVSPKLQIEEPPLSPTKDEVCSVTINSNAPSPSPSKLERSTATVSTSPTIKTTRSPINHALVVPQIVPQEQKPADCGPINNFNKNRKSNSKFAILNTVITDVTVNDHTITISESKTNRGFFKEVSRQSVAVDTGGSSDCMDPEE